MYMQMIVMLALASAFVEVAFVKGSKRFAHIMHYGFWKVPAIWCNLIFSTGLSLTLGHLFGAEGLIALMGGLTSTVMTAVYYPQMDRIDALWAQRGETQAQLQHVALVTWKTVVFFWKFFTAPVRLAMWVTPRVKAGWLSIVAFYDALPFTHRKALA